MDMKEPKWFCPCGDGWEPVPATEAKEEAKDVEDKEEAKEEGYKFHVPIQPGPHGFGI
jgi:hypothetical protein